MMSEHSTIIENDEEFVQITYNAVSIYQRKKDGYINATKLCSDAGRDFRTLKRSKRWNDIINYYLSNEISKDVQNCTPLYELKKSYNQMQGQYITPDLIHFVAEWLNIEYSFKVKHIMDSVNEKVHEVLQEKQLPDTVENAKPIFVEVAKQIAPSIQTSTLEQQCWGVRDNPRLLDQWERDDLRKCIDDYKNIKERLREIEQKLNEYGSFIEQHDLA